MTPLEKRILKDHRMVVSMMNTFYNYNLSQIGKLFQSSKTAMVSIVAGNLAQVVGDLNYKNVRSQGIDKKIETELDQLIKASLVVGVEETWVKLHKHMQLFGMLSTAFSARKATPPWKRVRINVSQKKHKKPNSLAVNYHLENMTATLMREISRGLLNEEPIGKIIQRIKNLFGPERVRESRVFREARKPDDTGYEDTVQFGLDNPVELSEGIYDMDDIAEFRRDLNDANGWDYRGEKQWFSDAMRRRNQALRSLEQDMASDVLSAVSSGQITVGSPDMGIDDFNWVVSRPQPRCDECTKRDGKAMSWIAENIDDDYGDQPPPLHPNCRCALVPKIKDTWAKSALEDDGYEWDQDSGYVFNPTTEQRKSGYQKMSWDEMLDGIGLSQGDN